MSAILEFADKLRSQIDISDVVGRYVELRRLGSNYKGLCPFHNEKTPSFTVSASKQIFHCFGCHEGGDVIKFTQKIERLEWMDAVRHLSREFGIPMPELRPATAEENQAKDARTSALQAVAFAEDFYQRNLQAALTQKHEITGYLQRRGLTPSLQKQFHLGLAPDAWSTLLDTAAKKGFSRDNLTDAGLIIKHATKDRHYDRFRKRLIFPIFDVHGAPVAFGARVYAADASPEEPKYINSPETLAYHKGQALYALNLAKDSIVRDKKAVLMEGYMDVIIAHAHGVSNAVASCGTALTEEQARLLKRFCSHVVFAYDGDEAGQKAMLRGTEVLLAQGFQVNIITLPGNHDPDSFLSEFGAEAFANLVGKCPGFFGHFLAQAAAKFDLKSPEGKVQTVELMLPLLRRVANPIARNDYARKLADRLEVDVNLIQRQLKDGNPNSLDRLKETMASVDADTNGIVEKTLLKLMVECHHSRVRIREHINPEWLRSPLVKKWFAVCEQMQSDELTWENLLSSEEAADRQDAAFLRSLAIEEAVCDTSERTITNVAARLSRHYGHEKSRMIQREVTEFYESGQTLDLIEEHTRRADENSRSSRHPSGTYFLKNHIPPRRG